MSLQHAAEWISKLNLQPHPEGGYYKEVFRSEQYVSREGSDFLRQACTSIYYLLEDEDFSGFHRIMSDEIWYFHQGVPLNVHVIAENGEYRMSELSGSSTGSLSLVVPAGLWFAADIPSKSGYSLVSCAVAPGFDFSEFEMADKSELLRSYPFHEALFNRLCR